MATKGSYVHNSMVTISGASRKFLFYAVSSKFSWFQTKRFTGLLELIKLYKQNSLEEILIFTIYQNYTLALIDTVYRQGIMHALDMDPSLFIHVWWNITSWIQFPSS